MASALMVILSLGIGRGPIKSQDTQCGHIIPNSHSGPSTDYPGFTGNLIGTQDSYLRRIQWVGWFYFLNPDKPLSKLGQSLPC